MKKIYIVLTILLAFNSFVYGQVNKDSLAAYISKNVSAYDLPGLSISIIKDQEIDFQQAFGVENQETNEALQTQSVFGIASLSKAFTAASIGMLVDEGKLDWKDKVKDFIPAFELSNDYVASQLTVEDLLSHRSGFSTFDGDLLWYGTNYSRDEIVRRFAKYPMSYDFRTTYGYQNIMFIIAGEVVEKVSGMSWDEYIETQFFKRLEMNNSYTSIDDFPANLKIARPHVKGKLDEIRNYDNSGGAAAISSNVEDLSNWIKMWLNDGVFKNDTLLQIGTVQKILSLHTNIPPSGFDRGNGISFKGYGLGWFLMDYNDGMLAQHGGGLPGYISKIFLFPEEKLGGIILTNGETSLPSALMYHVIDEYKGNNIQEDWAATYLNFSKNYDSYLEKKETERVNSRKAKVKSQFKKEELVGTYEDEIYGKAKIELKGGELTFTMLPAKEIFTSKMEPWHFNSYKIRFKDKFLPFGILNFETNSNGEAVGFKIDLPNPDFHFYKLHFEKVE